MSLEDKVGFFGKLAGLPNRVFSKCKSLVYDALRILPNHPGVFVVDHSDPWTESHEDTWLRNFGIACGAIASVAALAIGGWTYRREIHAELDPAYSVRLNAAKPLRCYSPIRSDLADALFWYAVDNTKFDVNHARSVANSLARSGLDDPRSVLDYVVSLNCPAKNVDSLVYRICLSGVSSSDDVVRVIDSFGVARADEIFGTIYSRVGNKDLLVREYLVRK